MGEVERGMIGKHTHTKKKKRPQHISSDNREKRRVLQIPFINQVQSYAIMSNTMTLEREQHVSRCKPYRHQIQGLEGSLIGYLHGTDRLQAQCNYSTFQYQHIWLRLRLSTLVQSHSEGHLLQNRQSKLSMMQPMKDNRGQS